MFRSKTVRRRLSNARIEALKSLDGKAHERLRESRYRKLFSEQLESRIMLASDWQNPLVNVDVNDDGVVTPLDVLLVINAINLDSRGTKLNLNEPIGDRQYYDVSGDVFLTPLDVLQVINYLNRRDTSNFIDSSLVNDSGESSSDLITNDPTIVGMIPNIITAGIVKARIDRGPVLDIPMESDGTFRFDPTALNIASDGSRTAKFYVEQGSTRALKHLNFTLDTVSPVISDPRLLQADDTGRSDSDNITTISRPRISIASETGAKVQVKLDSTTLYDGSISNATTNVSPNQPLSDGTRQMSVVATDLAGNRSTSRLVPLTIDTIAPSTSAMKIAGTSRTANQTDQETSYSRVTIDGTSEANSFVSFVGVNGSVRSAGDGTFRIPNVALNLGLNSVAFLIEDLAGNRANGQTDFTRLVASLDPDPVLRWNQATLDSIRLDATPAPVASRALALVSIAALDVVNAIEKTPGYLVSLPAPSEISTEAAISSASFTVLSYLYPGQISRLQSLQSASLASIANGLSKTQGESFGQLIGQAVIALRDGDGWNKFVDYVPGSEPGSWRETSPMFAPALVPQWGQVTPFALDNIQTVSAPAPPSLTSQIYATSVNEVQSLGKAIGSTRTSDQTEIARFWAAGSGTYTPPGEWNEIAAQFASSQGLSPGENARLFGMLNTALGDAGIVAWNTKYAYDLWRPISAIQNAASDGNSLTTADADWSSLLITPPFPEYTSGHSTYSAAAAEILTAYFGDNRTFTAESSSLPNVTRSFTSFNQAAEEAGRSRIYGGIHYEFTNQASLASGHAIGKEVLARFSVADDTMPPQIVFLSPPNAIVTNLNPTINGWALDNLSGVASGTVQVDNGSITPIEIDSNGRFSFTPTFSLNGNSDGPHVVHFRATDHAGLQSKNYHFTFTLDTIAPSLSITSPVASSTLSSGAQLTGVANGTGSSIVALSYRIDSGPTIPLTFNRTEGSFNQPMDLSRLAAGSHTLVVSATDAAGLKSSNTVQFSLASASLLAVTSVTPAAGSSDVSTTYRPQVFFSRPINTATLNPNNFYATNSSGTKVPATIVPSQDGSFAWLFFTNPLPGASTISVHVNGESILGADGSKLDADNNGTAGGELIYRFTTVSLVPLVNTKLSGRVFDPGPDLKPMTFDDLRAGPDGFIHSADDVFLNPISGVKVHILGLESQTVYTDGNGFFHFDAVPSGNIKLAVDGRTATNAPNGFYFPEMVLDLNMVVGQSNTIMGTMGTREQRDANLDRQEMYLPRIQSSILKTVSDTVPTTLGVDAESAPNLTDQQRPMLTLEVQPNSLVGADGLPVKNAKIGISAVPPELVRDMLPPGLLQHTFDISIQAPDGVKFNTPLAATFPNVFNSAPGTKLNFLSFDHTTGRLVIEGTATVSEDGLSVSTDPGMGFTKPGWGGLTPPGSTINGQGRIDNSPCGGLGNGQVGQEVRNLVGNGLNAAGNLLGVATAATSFIGSSVTSNFIGGLATGVDLANAIQSGNKADFAKVVLDFTGFIPGPIGIASRIARGLWAAYDLRNDLNNIQNNLDNVRNALNSGCNTTEGLGANFDAGEEGPIENLLSQIFAQQPYYELIGSDGPRVQELLGRSNSGLNNFGLTNEELNELVQRLTSINQALTYLSTVPGINELSRELYELVSGELTNLYSETSVPLSNAIVSLSVNGQVISTTTNREGNWSVFVPDSTYYTVSILALDTLQTGHSYGYSGASGTSQEMHPIQVFTSVGLNDFDGDGLADEAEDILGTLKSIVDTDRDGISDFAEMQQGLDPLSGIPAATGLIGAVPLNGEANEVKLSGSILSSNGQTAYVATGSYGMAIVDVSAIQKVSVISQLSLTGFSSDVDVDASRGIAALAAGEAGIHLVDVNNSNTPILKQTVRLPNGATSIEVFDGIIYAGSTSSTGLYLIDLLTGEPIQSIGIGSGIVDLARDGQTLYAVTINHELKSIDLASDLPTVMGSLLLPQSGGKLFVGNGVAYVGLNASTSQGFLTVNVSDPKNMSLFSDADAINIAGASIVANGSGLGVSIGNLRNIGSVLHVVNAVDPTNTGAFITQFALPTTPYDVAIGSGIAFVAGGQSGLHVVNYRAFDSLGIPPTVALATTIDDNDANSPGLQVVEGSFIPLSASFFDDVQVRNVELLVNGKNVINDVSFPFELSTVLPTIATNGSNIVTLQSRATDTGGNSSLSSVLTVQLVPDMAAPKLIRTNISENSKHGSGFRAITFDFSESIDLATINATNFVLTSPSGIVSPLDIQSRRQGRSVQLTYPTLALGMSTLSVDAANVKDLAGNRLGADSLNFRFEITPYTIAWTNQSGGEWNDPANWENNRIPGSDDDVLINLPDNATITISNVNIDIRSLTSSGAINLSTSGSLSVRDTIRLDNTLTLTGGTLANATVHAISSTGKVVFTSASGTLDGVRFDSDLDLASNNGARANVVNGLTLNGTAYIGNASGANNGTISFKGTQTFGGTGTVVFGKGEGNYLSTHSEFVNEPNLSILTIGPSINIRGSSGSISTGYVNSLIINQGTIAADDSGAQSSFENDSNYVEGGFATSTSATIDISGISNPAPQLVYQTARQYFFFTYTLKNLTVGNSYNVRLHFAEIQSRTAGERKFDISINGTVVASDFDIVEAAGGLNKAIVRDFTAVADANGEVIIHFNNRFGYAQLNGLEILSGSTVLKSINAGQDAGGIFNIGSAFKNEGTIVVGSREILNLGGDWTNLGRIDATNATINLGGEFTFADIGILNRLNSTVNLTGTLDNTGTTLSLNASTGSWNLAGGTIKNGTLQTEGAKLFLSGGNLDGVTINGDLDLATRDSSAYVLNGLTLNGTAYLGDAAGASTGGLYFKGTQTLGGAGTFVFGTRGGNFLRTYNNTAPDGGTLTIAPSITIRGSSGDISTGLFTGDIINQGTIIADNSGGLSSFAYDNSFQQIFNYPLTSTLSPIETTGVSQPAPQVVYQTARTGNNFAYTLANLIAGSSYTLRLHFAEIENRNVGGRKFGVKVNGQAFLTEFDIVSVAGGINKAVVRELTAVADSTGKITINFDTVSSQASINGIELLSGSTVVQAINAGLMPVGTINVTSDFLNQGSMEVRNGGTLALGGDWSNTGTISLASNSVLNLGGLFTLADIGTINRNGGTLNLNGTLDNTGTTLSLNASTGSWNLAGGTIKNGIVTQSGVSKLLFSSSGGTLDGVRFDSDLDLASDAPALINVTNGLTLNGIAYIGNASGATYGRMYFRGAQTLGGTGTVIFGKNEGNFLGTYRLDANAPDTGTLTIGPSITIRGSSGNISAGYYDELIINQGTIFADDSGGSSRFGYDSGLSFSNIVNSAAVIDTSGVTNPAPQVVYQTARRNQIAYTLSNLTPGNSYAVRLHFAELENIPLGNRKFDILINNTVVASDFDIVAIAGGINKAVIRDFTAVANANGEITVNLSNKVNFAILNGLELLSGVAVLQSINAGQAAGGTFNIASTFRNEGTMKIGAEAVLNLGGSWSNRGRIEATDATINLGGNFKIADVGIIQRTNSSVNLTGILDNTGTTLALNSTSGSWNLAGGTIRNGIVTQSGGSKLLFSSSGGTLDGVRFDSDLDLASDASALIYVTNGLTLNGIAYIGNASGATYGRMYFRDAQTFGGTGTVIFGKNEGNFLGTYNLDFNDPDAGKLIIGPSITIRGSSGRIADGSATSTIINQGTIAADDSSGPSSFERDKYFSPDSNFELNTAASIDTSGVPNAAPELVYQTARKYYNFAYTLPNLTVGNSYTIRLHFAELENRVVGNGKFDISVNRTVVAPDFDIVAAAGGINKAIVREFNAIADANGEITINFDYKVGLAQLNGLEILSDTTVIKSIDAGQVAGGTFNIGSTFKNEGTIKIGAENKIKVQGNFVLSPTSKLTVDLAGTEVNLIGKIEVDRELNLIGSLNVNFVGNFSPEVGQQFIILSSDSITGSFNSILATNLAGNLGVRLIADNKSGSVEVINQVSSRRAILGSDMTSNGSPQIFNNENDVNFILSDLESDILITDKDAFIDSFFAIFEPQFEL